LFKRLFQALESFSHLRRSRRAGSAYLLDGDRGYQVSQQGRLAGLCSTAQGGHNSGHDAVPGSNDIYYLTADGHGRNVLTARLRKHQDALSPYGQENRFMIPAEKLVPNLPGQFQADFP
jgi:hypothetical protein